MQANRKLLLAAVSMAGVLAIVTALRMSHGEREDSPGRSVTSTMAVSEPSQPEVLLQAPDIAVREPVRSSAGMTPLADGSATSSVTVRGVVVDESEQPVAEAIVYVMAVEGDPPCLIDYHALPRTDTNGRFILDRWYGKPRAHVKALHPDYEDDPGQVVMLDGTELHLTLHYGGEIRGSVFLGEGVHPTGIFMKLGDSVTGWQQEIVEWSPLGTVMHESHSWANEDGSFAFRGQKSGSYTLRVALGPHSKPLLEIAGITVVSGRTTVDPRLNPLDLRSVLHVLHLRVRDENDKPVQEPFASRTKQGPSTEGVSDLGEGCLLVLAREPSVDLYVGALGYRTVHLTDVSADRDVVLQHGVTVKVALRGTRVPTHPMFLRVALVDRTTAAVFATKFPAGNSHIVERSRSGEGAEAMTELREPAGFPYFDGRDLDDSGSATLDLPDKGLYVVRWYLARKLARSDALDVTEIAVGRPQILNVDGRVVEPTFDVYLDESAVANAVAHR